jgi:hypothetical protein
MPSPFPGMDPYLEGPKWMSVHSALTVEIARQLSRHLPPRYVALPNERMVVTMSESDDVSITRGSILPDTSIVDLGAPEVDVAESSKSSTAVATPVLMVETLMPESIPHVTVEIRDSAADELVTAIEVLSPTNKGSDGREEYLTKRRRILLSTAHLVEIDLLRNGMRLPTRPALPSFPYFVLVGRAERRPHTEVHPIRLADSLPTVPIPLLVGDVDVQLDLQQAITSVYDTFHFARMIDYSRPPAVALRPAKLAAWAEEHLGKWRKPGGEL